MTLLRDRGWRLKYTPDHGDLVALLYEPALTCAVRYDRLTGYFAASALALAARGVEWLVMNGGRMRMVVGCTLEQPEIDAIERGEALKAMVEHHLLKAPLSPPDHAAAEALELLAWLVAEGRLEVRVAVPCDADRRPVPAEGLFHEKAGIVEDKTGERIAFNGSLNETAAGWTRNWESLNVFTSWRDVDRVDEEDANFARLWADKAARVVVLDVPAAAREDLLRFLPADDRPARLGRIGAGPAPTPALTARPEPAPEPPHPTPALDPRRAVWEFIALAPRLPGGGVRVGEATAAVTPWPHQLRALDRLWEQWPPKLLIADEVGLGKTVQAGLLLRQAWLSGRARRILILAPKNVCRQWQVELREKFNLNWPVYDGDTLAWHPSPALAGRHERPAGRDEWHEEPLVIASSHLVRRRDRARELLEAAEPWDLIVLDEAHHARRRGAGSAGESGPNALLRLMRGLKDRTGGLLLLTATPMQVHPVEMFDLLGLLGLPAEWTEESFLRFFEEVGQESPGHEAFERLAALFRAVEASYGPVAAEEVQRLGGVSGLKARSVLRALRDKPATPRRQLEAADRRLALRLMRLHTPVARLVSRHTRELLRRYHKAGKLSTPIAERDVRDRFIDLTPDERRVYEAVEEYISTTWNQAIGAAERNAVGFVMTIYRRRLASSFFALARTLEGHLRAIASPGAAGPLGDLDEDLPDDEAAGEEPDAEEAARLEREALELEERSDIERLLAMVRRLPPDTKLERLRDEIAALRADGYAQAMVFTQFTGTMDFLRRELVRDADARVMCFSGRGGEVPARDGTWRAVSRDEAKRRFREGEADLLLCTDAAAEGLNFQFCGALVNYDMPWNPMRVEQRIGRIDRLGQRHPVVRIVNLHYADTVEADVYRALRERIGLFQKVVGRLQPILSRLPTLIAERVRDGRAGDADERRAAAAEVGAAAADAGQGAGFDIDAVTEADLATPPRHAPALTMADLERVIAAPALLPPGIDVEPLGPREYALRMPGFGAAVRVATDPAYYEQHADSVELWSPGNPTFPSMASESSGENATTANLRELLDGFDISCSGAQG